MPTRPKRPTKPRKPEIFTHEEIMVHESGNWVRLSMSDGPRTLDEIIDALPEGIPLEEVVVRAESYGSEGETGWTRITFQRVKLVEDAEARLTKYRHDMHDWGVFMEEHKTVLREWFAEQRDLKKAQDMIDKRKELEELEARSEQLQKELNDVAVEERRRG